MSYYIVSFSSKQVSLFSTTVGKKVKKPISIAGFASDVI